MGNNDIHTDKTLFQTIAQGDAAAYTILFGRYFEQLRWRALKLLKSDVWAEEIVEEVFLQLWINRESLSAVEIPHAYLYKLTNNRCFDRIRRQRLEVEMQYAVSQALHGEAPPAVDAQYDLANLEKLIREAVEQLPPQRKLIYRLQQEEGLSYQEIADQLGLSRNTVRNQVSRTLQAIRNYLQQKGVAFLILFSYWYLC